MSLADVLRKGIATARKITDSLHVNVMFLAWTGQDVNGAPTYATPRTLRALVTRMQTRVMTDQGQYVMSNAQVVFIEPITPNGAASRVEPIDNRDVIILPDGVTGPILKVNGFFDGGTGAPFYSEVFLG